MQIQTEWTSRALFATAAMFAGVFAFSISTAQAQSVNCNSPSEDLQKEIDSAKSGSELRVVGNCDDGPYVIRKDLTLVGNPNATLSTQSGGSHVLIILDHAVQVLSLTVDAQGTQAGGIIASGASVEIRDVVVDGASNTGIQVSESSSARIEDSTIRNNGIGVLIFGSAHALLQRNDIYGNTFDGVSLTLSSSGNLGPGNDIYSNGQGVVVNGNSSIFLNGDTIRDNTRNGLFVVRSSFVNGGFPAVNTIEDNGVGDPNVADVTCLSRGFLEFGTPNISSTKTTIISADCDVSGAIF